MELANRYDNSNRRREARMERHGLWMEDSIVENCLANQPYRCMYTRVVQSQREKSESI